MRIIPALILFALPISVQAQRLSQQWRFKTITDSSIFYADPSASYTRADGLSFITGQAQQTFGGSSTLTVCLNPDGRELWRDYASFQSPVTFTRQILADDSANAYMLGNVPPRDPSSYYYGLVIKYGPDGTTRWIRQTGDSSGRHQVLEGLYLKNNRIYAIGSSDVYGGQINCIRPENGNPIWSHDSTPPRISFAANSVHITDSNAVWIAQRGDIQNFSPPVIYRFASNGDTLPTIQCQQPSLFFFNRVLFSTFSIKPGVDILVSGIKSFRHNGMLGDSLALASFSDDGAFRWRRNFTQIHANVFTTKFVRLGDVRIGVTYADTNGIHLAILDRETGQTRHDRLISVQHGPADITALPNGTFAVFSRNYSTQTGNFITTQTGIFVLDTAGQLVDSTLDNSPVYNMSGGAFMPELYQIQSDGVGNLYTLMKGQDSASTAPQIRFTKYQNRLITATSKSSHPNTLAYPNPAGDWLYLPGLSDTYELRNLLGKTVWKGVGEGFSTQSISSGTYILQCTSTGQSQRIQIVH